MLFDYFSDELRPLSDHEKNLLQQKVDVDKLYGLPQNVNYCTSCAISNQRPRIEFKNNGECNACSYWRRKDNEIDWEERESELRDLCNRFRRNDGHHDVLVPSSGGKDSVYVAHMLKAKYGMNPLTMTWAPSVYTEIGFRNLLAQVHSGFDNVLYTPNGLVHRRMCRISTIEVGDPFQPFIYGQVYLPIRVAAEKGIQLIMDGENGEAEYGGDPITESKKGFSSDDSEKYWLSNFPVEYWRSYGFSDEELNLYLPPDPEKVSGSGIERHFFSYYVNWRPQDHFYYCAEKTNFHPNPNGRSEGTFSKYASLDDHIDPYHYYFSLLKFGIARATSDAAHEIREGILDRDEAVALVLKFDSEAPSEQSKDIFLRYTGFNEDELSMVIERWRNARLWSWDGSIARLNFQVL